MSEENQSTTTTSSWLLFLLIGLFSIGSIFSTLTAISLRRKMKQLQEQHHISSTEITEASNYEPSHYVAGIFKSIQDLHEVTIFTKTPPNGVIAENNFISATDHLMGIWVSKGKVVAETQVLTLMQFFCSVDINATYSDSFILILLRFGANGKSDRPRALAKQTIRLKK